VRKLRFFAVFVVVLLAALPVVAVRAGWVAMPGSSRYAELTSQLRDRSTVAVVGSAPLALPAGDAILTSVTQFPPLATALEADDPERAIAEYHRRHLDGLLVRTDRPSGAARSLRHALTTLRPTRGFSAVYLDDVAALYETSEPITLEVSDARRLVSVARLIMSGAVAPPERIFPEALRRTQPVEVALMLRDGHDPILWRSTRGGTVARAFLDVCFAVLDRWSAQQQARYGSLRVGLQRLSITLAIFYDKGVLGARSPEFLRRAADPRVWAVGYERLATWEYALPPTPWAPAADPSAALRQLAREHNVPAPGYLRPELTIYRFRALQMFEMSPGGGVEVFDPH
jgi:hypothetical protein